MAQVEIPTRLQERTGGASRIEIDAHNIRQLLRELDSRAHGDFLILAELFQAGDPAAPELARVAPTPLAIALLEAAGAPVPVALLA